MRKLLLCLALTGACFTINNLSKQATSTSYINACIDCGGCCACVRYYPGGPCDWQCC